MHSASSGETKGENDSQASKGIDRMWLTAPVTFPIKMDGIDGLGREGGSLA